MLGEMRVLRYLKEHRLAGGVAVLAATQFAASVAGLLRDRILNSIFSNNLAVVDAYLSAFRPSDLLFQACIMSAMGTVLVPVLAGYHAKDNGKEMGRLLSGATGMAALVFGAISLVLAITFPWIAPLLVQFKGETLELYVSFGRLALLVNFFFVFGNSLGQYLITVQKYWIYGITPILYTAGTIAGALWLTPIVGPYGPMYGTIIGVVIYVLYRLYGVLRTGASLKPVLWHPDLPEMAILMLPRVLAFGAFQLQLLFLDRLASGFPEGAVTINNNTRNFQSVLVGVVGIAIAQAVYSILSQAAAKNNADRFRKYYRQGIFLCLLLTIPGAVVLVALSPVAAYLVHLSDYLQVFTIFLAIYAVSIPFESITHLQYRAFYAMKETLTPAAMGVIGGVAAIGVSYLLSPRLGVYGIPLGFTVGEIVQATGLAVLLPARMRRYMKPSKNSVTPDLEP